MDLVERVRASRSAYDECASICAGKLQRIMQQMALSSTDQTSIIDQCITEAEGVWRSAVVRAEAKQANMLQMAQDAIEEVARIKQSLGEAQEQQSPAAAITATTKAQLDHALASLQVWRERRDQRANEVEALMAANASMAQQLYGPASQPPSVSDLTSANIDFLRMEQERLKGERDKRWRRMEEEAGRLRALCKELGCEAAKELGEVHPSLRCIESSDAAVFETAMSTADLSDTSFSRMASKHSSLGAVKVEREQQLRQLRDVLVSLWDAVGVQESAPERDVFAKLMAAPSRLQTSSLDQVQAEVRRLEECRASAMRDLVVSKARELQAVCAGTHVPVPDIQTLLADLNRRTSEVSEGGSGPGQISESLAKVVRALADASALAAHRKPVVGLIGELQSALEEAAWLRAYETDTDRFKGRDCNAKLQRSIKATKVRAAIPGMIARCRDRLDAWQLAEGEAFLYDGKPYLEVLDQVQAEYEASQAQPAPITRTPAKKGDAGIARPATAGLRSSVALTRSVNLTAALTPQASTMSLRAPLAPGSVPRSHGSNAPTSTGKTTGSRQAGSSGTSGRPKTATPGTGSKAAKEVDQAGASPMAAASDAAPATPGSGKKSTGTSGVTTHAIDVIDIDTRRYTADDQTTPRMVPLATPPPSRIPRFTVQ